MSDAEDSALPASSKLGTKEYWDAHYALELGNYEESQDEGEIWFGKQAETRAVQYIVSQASAGARVLDVGCGNGHFLRRLRVARSDWSELRGTDYSEPSIALCTKIEEEQREEGETEILYTIFDILSAASLASLGDGRRFDFVHDKGTWDAISLSDDRASRLSAYRTALAALLTTNGGQFVIVSCNYTTAELRAFFESGDEEEGQNPLKFVGELPEPKKAAPAFSFGGKTGAPFHTAVFRRK